MPLPGGQVATMAAGNTRDAAGLWSTDADMDDAAPSHIELRKVTCRLERCFRESQKRVDRDRSEIRFLALTLSIPDDRAFDRTPLRPPVHQTSPRACQGPDGTSRTDLPNGGIDPVRALYVNNIRY
jgi:hypothetical protein